MRMSYVMYVKMPYTLMGSDTWYTGFWAVILQVSISLWCICVFIEGGVCQHTTRKLTISRSARLLMPCRAYLPTISITLHTSHTIWCLYHVYVWSQLLLGYKMRCEVITKINRLEVNSHFRDSRPAVLPIRGNVCVFGSVVSPFDTGQFCNFKCRRNLVFIFPILCSFWILF